MGETLLLDFEQELLGHLEGPDISPLTTALLLYLGHALAIAFFYGGTYFLFYMYKPSMDYMERFKYNKGKYPDSKIVRKEVWRSLVHSGIADTTYYILLLVLRSRGYVPVYFGSFGVVDLVVLASLLFWGDTHFYIIHRTLHNKWLYKKIHNMHHESYNTNPWSGLSFHPVESFVYFSSVFLVLVLPMHIFNYYALKIGLLLAPVNGHIGYGSQGGIISSRCHNLHHLKKNVNFGSMEIWDRVFGTYYME